MTKRAKDRGATPESRLISFEDGAMLLGGMHPNTIRQRKAGTENLTHVHGFGRRIFLIRSEVEALVEEKISQSLIYDRKLKRQMGS
jgi:hypothetical protein